MLHTGLPIDVQHALKLEDVPRVRDCNLPVRWNQPPQQPVHLGHADYESDLQHGIEASHGCAGADHGAEIYRDGSASLDRLCARNSRRAGAGSGRPVPKF
jgi:hypothetical protein